MFKFEASGNVFNFYTSPSSLQMFSSFLNFTQPSYTLLTYFIKAISTYNGTMFTSGG